MKKDEKQAVGEVKGHLIELGGRTTQELGLGRIVGLVLAYIYFCEGECSLNEIEEEIGLSKAAVSIAARQMESFGLVHKVWRKGDRKHYYRLERSLDLAIRKGLLPLVRAKLGSVGAELDHAEEVLGNLSSDASNEEAHFVRKRLESAQLLRKRVDQILDSPIVKLLEDEDLSSAI
jgi:DNA-binding transcriptional regulator GbsR (MarR family)